MDRMEAWRRRNRDRDRDSEDKEGNDSKVGGSTWAMLFRRKKSAFLDTFESICAALAPNYSLAM